MTSKEDLRTLLICHSLGSYTEQKYISIRDWDGTGMGMELGIVCIPSHPIQDNEFSIRLYRHPHPIPDSQSMSLIHI